MVKGLVSSKGNTQTYGVNNFQTSLFACLNSIRILIFFFKFWVESASDVKNAFLYGSLSKKVYMEQPTRFTAQEEFGIKVCKLNKTIYELKQFPLCLRN